MLVLQSCVTVVCVNAAWSRSRVTWYSRSSLVLAVKLPSSRKCLKWVQVVHRSGLLDMSTPSSPSIPPPCRSAVTHSHSHFNHTAMQVSCHSLSQSLQSHRRAGQLSLTLTVTSITPPCMSTVTHTHSLFPALYNVYTVLQPCVIKKLTS